MATTLPDPQLHLKTRVSPQAVPAGWRRWLLPSFSDLLFVFLIFWMFLLGSGWLNLLSDADSGWHIRTGEYILDHHTVPHQDIFSFSKPGAPWFAWEWLADVLYAVLWRAAGLKGLVLFSGVMIGATGLLLFRQMLWRGGNAGIAFVLGLMTIGASTVHFNARPHLFTLLFLVLSQWLIRADQEMPSNRIWWLVPLTALWTNLHGGFAILILLLMLLTFGTGVETWMKVPGRTWAQCRRYALLTGACVTATMLNPYGYQLHVHIATYLRSDWIKNLVQEFQAPRFRTEAEFQYEILLLLAIVMAGWCLQKRRITEALWLLAFAHLSLSSLRHMPLFVLIAAPLLVEWLTPLVRSAVSGFGDTSVPGILWQMGEDAGIQFRRTTFWPVVFVIYLTFFHPGPWPTDYPVARFPVVLVHKYQDELVRNRVLTDDQWGDYLIYASYPGQRVFIDGRSDFYGPEVGHEYLGMVQGRYDWQSILKKNAIEVVLSPSDWPLASLLKLDGGWRLQEDAGTALLFVRQDRYPLKAGHLAGRL